MYWQNLYAADVEVKVRCMCRLLLSKHCIGLLLFYDQILKFSGFTFFSKCIWPVD